MSSRDPEDRFGPYELKGVIGRGAFGVVHRAVQTSLRREVAIKILEIPEGKSGSTRERFKREVDLHCRLSHPNLVRILDAGLEGDRPYLAMELLEGPTLQQLLREQGKIPPRTAIAYGTAMAFAIEYLHEQGILHRDLKSANIIIHQRKDLKVLDFGLARGEEDSALTRPGTLVGTPAFMAPETFMKQGYSPASDAYAVGVIMYSMLSGRLPFTNEAIDLHVKAKIAGKPIPLTQHDPSIHPRLADAVMRLLAGDPQHRMTLEAFRHQIADHPADRGRSGRTSLGDSLPPTPARGLKAQEGPPTPSSFPTRRRPAVMPVAAMLGVVAILGAGAWISRPRSGEETKVTPAPSSSPSAAPEPTRSERLARLVEWHSRIHQDLVPLEGKGADGRYWARLLTNLARAVRAPVPSLNHVTKVLNGPATTKQRQDLLRTLADSAAAVLVPDAAAASRLLAQEDPDLTTGERWRILEVLTPLRLLDRALELTGSREKVTGSETWLGARSAPSMRADPGERAGWFQVRTYLVRPDYEKIGSQIDLLDGARKHSAEEPRVDHVTGTAPREDRHIHLLEEKIPVTPLSAGDPRGESVEIGLWRVKGNPSALFGQDLLWVILPGRAPLPLHLGMAARGQPPPGGDLFIEQRLPAGSLGKETSVTVKVAREFLFPPDGPSDANVTIGLGWIRASRAVK